jgi:hypothetical protein
MKNKMLVGTGIIVILLLIIASLGLKLYEKYTKSVNSNSIQQPQQQQQQQQQQLQKVYLNNDEQGKLAVDFEQKLYAVEKKAKEAKDDVDREMKDIQRIMPSQFTIRKAYDKFREVSEEIKNIPVPEGLSPENSTVFYLSRDKFAEAYSQQSTAMMWLSKFIETGDKLYADYHSDEINKTNALLFESVGKIIDLQVKLGVDISKKGLVDTEANKQQPITRELLAKGQFGDILFGIGTDFKAIKSKWGERKLDQFREGGAGYFYKECNCSFFVGDDNQVGSIEKKTDITIQKLIEILGNPNSEGWNEIDFTYELFYEFDGKLEVYANTSKTRTKEGQQPPSRNDKIGTVTITQK